MKETIGEAIQNFTLFQTMMYGHLVYNVETLYYWHTKYEPIEDEM